MGNSITNTKPVFLTDQLVTSDIATQMNSLTSSEPPYTDILNLTTIFNSISSTMTNDTFAQKIIEKLNSTTPLIGWNWQANRLYYEQHLYVPDHEDLCLQIICNHHNHPMAGHFGQTKTINLCVAIYQMGDGNQLSTLWHFQGHQGDHACLH